MARTDQRSFYIGSRRSWKSPRKRYIVKHEPVGQSRQGTATDGRISYRLVFIITVLGLQAAHHRLGDASRPQWSAQVESDRYGFRRAESVRWGTRRVESVRLAGSERGESLRCGGTCATERDDACRCESRDVLRPSSRRPESCRGAGAGVCAESLPVRCGSREALRRPSPSASGSRHAPSGPRGTSARSGTSRATAGCHRAGSCRTAARPSRRLRLAYVRRPRSHPPTDSARAMSQSFPYRARARRL
jgi:hypothetical protein